jgi:hypothetical protein
MRGIVAIGINILLGDKHPYFLPLMYQVYCSRYDNY